MADHPDDRDQFEQLVLNRLRAIFDRHPWLIATEYVQGSVGLTDVVRRLTEQPLLSVGAANGSGALPDDRSFAIHSLDMAPGDSMVDTMRRGQALLADPDPSHQALVDEWDPDGSARAVVSFTSVAGLALGRETFGARPASWRELEDKLAIESIWAAAGIPVAPSMQVAVADRDAVLAAHTALATPAGTVWAGDNRSGWHGGGAGTFWVPDRAAAEDLCSKLERFERIRIMPFLEGVPCSMHGMVVPDGDGGAAVITFRPCEMLVLRDREQHRFVYCRSATFWDPEPGDRNAMADTAKRIGEELMERVGFRGVFTVDGVLGAEGFVPTEVNTRYGAALRGAHPTVSGEILPLVLVNMAIIEGLFDDVDLRPLGAIVTGALDQERQGRTFLTCSARPDRERTAQVRFTSDGHLELTELDTDGSQDKNRDQDREVGGDGDGDGDIVGPSPVATVQWTTMGSDGGVVNIEFVDPPVGPSLAPLLVEIIGLVDRQWSLGVTTLEAATALR